MRKGQTTSEEIKRKISEAKKKSYQENGNVIKEKFRESFTKEKRDLARKKSIQTCLERYGVENPWQSKEIQEKVKQTNRMRHGADFFSQTSAFKRSIDEYYTEEVKQQHGEKIKQGCFEKFGVFHASQLDSFQSHRRQTCLERYGVESYTQTNEFKKKMAKTCLERYGVENPWQSKEIQEKVKQTCLKRYGGFTFQSSELKEKVKQTCLDRYGVENHAQQHLSPILENLHSKEYWDSFKNFSEVKDNLKDYLSLSQIYLYVHRFKPEWKFKSSISSHHQRVSDFLNEYEIDHQNNVRSVITPYELDIYIPKHHLAIEINGVYWHSEVGGGKDKRYHLNKTEECEKDNFQLLQFWDYEIEQKWNIIKSMILSKCGIHQFEVDARECRLVEVPLIEEQKFLNDNHFQEYLPSSFCFGLYHQDELVSLMSFGKSKFNKKINWELLRFCNKINTNVIGGASKLFKMRPEGSIISYVDRRYSQGNLYNQLGFALKEINNPSYHYTLDYHTFFNRVKFQKHKLSDLLESYDPGKTEWENMKENGYDRIWDCGTLSFFIEVYNEIK